MNDDYIKAISLSIQKGLVYEYYYMLKIIVGIKPKPKAHTGSTFYNCMLNFYDS